MALLSKWFIGVPDSEKKDIEQLIRNSSIVLGQITKVIEAEIKENDALGVSDYENPNWAYRQADRNGALRVLRNLLKLTKIERTDHNV